ncbi:hypothetical protein BDR26DRAFT_867291 [Obelidium mucronatum]|nr:hypothetical protein BDR26DRAFT_867291 [Obelidium mucronatum]
MSLKHNTAKPLGSRVAVAPSASAPSSDDILGNVMDFTPVAARTVLPPVAPDMSELVEQLVDALHTIPHIIHVSTTANSIPPTAVPQQLPAPEPQPEVATITLATSSQQTLQSTMPPSIISSLVPAPKESLKDDLVVLTSSILDAPPSQDNSPSTQVLLLSPAASEQPSSPKKSSPISQPQLSNPSRSASPSPLLLPSFRASEIIPTNLKSSSAVDAMLPQSGSSTSTAPESSSMLLKVLIPSITIFLLFTGIATAWYIKRKRARALIEPPEFLTTSNPRSRFNKKGVSPPPAFHAFGGSMDRLHYSDDQEHKVLVNQDYKVYSEDVVVTIIPAPFGSERGTLQHVPPTATTAKTATPKPNYSVYDPRFTINSQFSPFAETTAQEASNRVVYGCSVYEGKKWPVAKANGGRWVWIGENGLVFIGEVDDEDDITVIETLQVAEYLYQGEVAIWGQDDARFVENWRLLLQFLRK